MAGNTQYFGVAYPTSTDYVKDGAVAIEAVADGFDAAVAIPTYNTQTGTSYTFALLDAAKVTTSNNAAAVTFTVPPQADVVWTTGATLTVANYGAGAVTIAGGSGVTITNSAATVGQFTSASIIRTGSDAWTVIPFAGGAAPLKDSAVSGTTGSPTTGTYTSGGLNYKTYSFTGTGSITFSKAGLVDLLVVAGGGGISTTSSGAGAGGYISQTNYYVSASTITVTVGAGGAASAQGDESRFDGLFAIGGGRADNGGSLNTAAGGSSGANSANSANLPVVGQGFNGFQGLGGGGGSSGAGGATAGGIGTSNSITGSAVTYATGGPKSGGAGAANTGNGSGGTGSTAGGSGIIIVRVLQ